MYIRQTYWPFKRFKLKLQAPAKPVAKSEAGGAGLKFGGGYCCRFFFLSFPSDCDLYSFQTSSKNSRIVAIAASTKSVCIVNSIIGDTSFLIRWTKNRHRPQTNSAGAGVHSTAKIFVSFFFLFQKIEHPFSFFATFSNCTFSFRAPKNFGAFSFLHAKNLVDFLFLAMPKRLHFSFFANYFSVRKTKTVHVLTQSVLQTCKLAFPFATTKAVAFFGGLHQKSILLQALNFPEI